MKKNINISASIVVYNEEFSLLKKTIECFLKIKFSKKLFLIDNSTTDTISKHFIHPDIEYIFVNKNIGFGAAHNLVLDKIVSDFHLILNPDIEFEENTIPILIDQLNNNTDVVFVTPKVIYPDGRLQNVCRKHISLLDLLNRKLKFSKTRNSISEYKNRNINKPFYPDFIHGCFMLFKAKEFKNLKGFDTRYFLYMEDADICREIDKIGKKKLFFPEISIMHHHRKGSSKSIKLFLLHITSAIKYFLKWGI